MRRMISLPPFDNNSYVWQGKDWKKINVYSDRNLGAPNLEGKEYLGNGVYRLYNADSITLDYNIFSGVYSMVGTPTSNSFNMVKYQLNGGETYTLSAYKISGTTNTISFSWAFANDIDFTFPNITQQTKTLQTYDTQIYSYSGVQYDIQFKIQIEKGSTATPYIPPAAPVKYYLEHDYEPLTMEGFINYDKKIFNDFSQIIENKK